MSEEYEVERTLGREEAVATMQAVVDGVASGTLRFDDDGESIDVEVPDLLEVEVELELDEDEAGAEVEVELEWPVEEPDSEESDAVAEGAEESGDEATEAPGTEGSEEQQDDTPSGEVPADDENETVDAIETAPLGPAASSESLARFEVYQDRADEWRWRLVHRNGNVIADGGEGYSRKQSALNGLRSVMQNAPGATVEDESGG